MKFSVFQVSRRGGRQKNEDRMGYCYTRESGLFVLADGMGGHPEGEVAAQLSIRVMATLYRNQAMPRIAQPADFLARALLTAHRRLLMYASTKGMLDTPRTTLVAAVLQDNAATWVHCGDSRLYIVRDGALLTRTRDHSYAEQTPPGGRPPRAVSRNVLFTCLGSPIKPVYDITGPVALRDGDRLLLCSDGLWSSVPEADIVHLMEASPVSQAVPELVEQALRRAGENSDNVTALALEWEMPQEAMPERGMSSDTTSEGMFAATIQTSGFEDMADDMDDAAIERSIAEINEAIRRSAGARKT